MRRLTEPREETDLSFVVETKRKKQIRVLALDPSTLGTPALKLREHFRIDVEGLDREDKEGLKEELLEKVKVGDAHTDRLIEYSRAVVYAIFGLVHYDDGFELETPLPRRMSRMTPGEWAEYAGAIEDEMTIGLARAVYSFDDLQAVANTVRTQNQTAVDQEKKDSISTESGETSTSN